MKRVNQCESLVIWPTKPPALLCACLWSWGTYHLAKIEYTASVQRPFEGNHQAVLCKTCIELEYQSNTLAKTCAWSNNNTFGIFPWWHSIWKTYCLLNVIFIVKYAQIGMILYSSHTTYHALLCFWLASLMKKIQPYSTRALIMFITWKSVWHFNWMFLL